MAMIFHMSKPIIHQRPIIYHRLIIYTTPGWWVITRNHGRLSSAETVCCKVYWWLWSACT